MRQHAADVRARLYGLVSVPMSISEQVCVPVEAPTANCWAQPKVQEIRFIPPEAYRTGRLKKNSAHPITRLLGKVSRATGISVTDIRSPRRQADVVKARFIFYYAAKALTSYSLPEIGRRSGGKDHTSVLNGVRRVQAVVDRLNIELPQSRFAMAKALWSAEWPKVSI
jgi:hypothetical protein